MFKSTRVLLIFKFSVFA